MNYSVDNQPPGRVGSIYEPIIKTRTINGAVTNPPYELPMEVIGAAMRKLLHLVYGVLKTGRPFDPNYLASLQVPS